MSDERCGLSLSHQVSSSGLSSNKNVSQGLGQLLFLSDHLPHY